MHTIPALAFLLLFSPCLNAQELGKDVPFHFVAHRGASYLAPENTLASIRLAWELGADAAECDVMLSSDHKVVLFHDKNTKKLTGKSHLISDTPWKELSKVIKPYYPKLKGAGRRPIGIQRMLRIHFL